ncbi:hypothetical protein GPECTOR_1g365 [Gonium pectorale]|uniref:Uncharacterized protein n=1 Tax=Gonium pectorale TaxID=33097 RepID=A0A150H4B1_GONPE|nr:hypothetical protein GPECTOR_1g365 [Gonium pectorale]|eukprot:KXZ56410.1 hypothetical protein GPECTOR_1g365 [Gonium pectorale]
MSNTPANTPARPRAQSRTTGAAVEVSDDNFVSRCHNAFPGHTKNAIKPNRRAGEAGCAVHNADAGSPGTESITATAGLSSGLASAGTTTAAGDHVDYAIDDGLLSLSTQSSGSDWSSASSGDDDRDDGTSPAVQTSSCKRIRPNGKDARCEDAGFERRAAAAVETIAAAALRARLRSHSKVAVQISASGWDLLSGRIEGAKVEGRMWESPLGLTAQVLDVQVGRVELDLPAVFSQQRIVLRNVPVGSARVVFTARDFGAFLQHPLVVTAARKAVQGRPFLFDRDGVAIIPEPVTGGCVLFSGTVAASGRRYQLTMRPAQGGRRAVVTAMPADMLGALAPSIKAHAGAESTRHAQQGRRPCGESAAAAGTGASVAAVSLATAGSGECEADPLVSLELSRFFSGLLVDLQGAELAFRAMRISAAAGGASSKERGRPGRVAEGLLDLELTATVRSFPPLNIQF